MQPLGKGGKATAEKALALMTCTDKARDLQKGKKDSRSGY